MSKYRTIASIALIFALLGLSACGGGGAAPTLKVEPQATVFTAGDAGSYFTAILSGSSETVHWSLSPALGTLSRTSGVSVKYTPPAALPSAQTVTLTASAGSLSATSTLTLNPKTVDVTGVVIADDGRPRSGVRVLIPGHPLVSSAADGSFSVSDVALPYQAIIEEDQVTKKYTLYDGVTRPDPTLYFAADPTVPAGEAHILGALNHSTASRKIGVDFVSKNALGAYILNSGSGTSTSYNLGVGFNDLSASGKLYALEWSTDSAHNAKDFTAFGYSDDMVLSAGDSISKDLDLSATTSSGHDFHPVITILGGMTLQKVTATVRFDDDSLLGMTTAYTVSQSPTLRSPDIAGAKMTVLALVSTSPSVMSAAWRSVDASETSMSLEVPAPPQLSEPSDGASGVSAGSEFSWQTIEQVINVFLLSDGPVSLRVYTTGSSLTLPDLSPFSVSYGANETYHWSVISASMPRLLAPNIDAMLDERQIQPLLMAMYTFLGGMPVGDQGLIISSERRSFTTPN